MVLLAPSIAATAQHFAGTWISRRLDVQIVEGIAPPIGQWRLRVGTYADIRENKGSLLESRSWRGLRREKGKSGDMADIVLQNAGFIGAAAFPIGD